MAATISFLGYDVSNRGVEADVGSAMDMVLSGRKGAVVATINPHSAVVADKNPRFASALHNADILLPDGIGIVIGGRMLGLPIEERVAGYDFFEVFSQFAQEHNQRTGRGLSYYFLGSSNQVLDAIVNRMSIEYPDIEIAGTFSPPFKPELSEEENAMICARINATRPDVLWVGMTAPKQEMWIEHNRHRLDVGFSAAIGAVFDFYAGTKPRAPQWAQKMGCEWLYRFYAEPKRMWRRYLVSNPRFVAMVMRERLRGA